MKAREKTIQDLTLMLMYLTSWEERAELDRRAKELEEMLKKPKEEQEKYFIPAEKLWADFGIPKPTPEEETEAYRRICYEVLYNNLQTWRAIRDYLGG